MLDHAPETFPGDRARILSFISGLLCCTALHAAPIDLKPGQAAPAITLQQSWNTPEGIAWSWEALRGQVVVLDFWATWCGPCVQGIPDLNKLARECRDLPVQFLAITDEPTEVVRAFLEKYPLDTAVGIDSDGATFQAFGVEARPHCVLVDQQGRVATVMRPQGLTREIILAVIEGRTDQLHEPLVRVELRRHVGVSKSSTLQTVPGGVKLQNLTLAALIQFVAPAAEGRVDFRTTVPQEVLDVEVAAPGTDGNAWRSLLRATLESTFGLRLREEWRMQDVLILTQVAGTTPRLNPPGKDHRSTSSLTRYANTAATLGRFAGDLSARLPLPVVDETGLAGEFAMELAWDQSKPSSIIASVREQLALELTPARRELLYLVVETSSSAHASRTP